MAQLFFQGQSCYNRLIKEAVSVDEIINYRDLPQDAKDNVLNQILSIGFCPAWGGVKEMQQEMEKSVEGRLPQYVFVRRDGALIGYLFLIAQAEKTSRVFPGGRWIMQMSCLWQQIFGCWNVGSACAKKRAVLYWRNGSKHS